MSSTNSWSWNVSSSQLLFTAAVVSISCLKDILIKHIKEDLKKAKEQEKDFIEIKKLIEKDFSDSPGYKYWKILVKKGEYANTAFIDWANEALLDLKKI